MFSNCENAIFKLPPTLFVNTRPWLAKIESDKTISSLIFFAKRSYYHWLSVAQGDFLFTDRSKPPYIPWPVRDGPGWTRRCFWFHCSGQSCLIFVTTVTTAGCVKIDFFPIGKRKNCFVVFYTWCKNLQRFYTQLCCETTFVANLCTFKWKISWPRIAVV